MKLCSNFFETSMVAKWLKSIEIAGLIYQGLITQPNQKLSYNFNVQDHY